jgi:hypothetical protein
MTKENITICNVGVHRQFPTLHLPLTVGDIMNVSEQRNSKIPRTYSLETLMKVINPFVNPL